MKEKHTFKIQPLSDIVIIRVDKAKDQTESGIYITESEKEKPQTGTVMAKGPGVDRPIQLSVGDTVFFSKFGGTEIKVDGESFLVLRERDIIGTLLN